ncbi:MAG: sulfatase [Pirellulales bacterium]
MKIQQLLAWVVTLGVAFTLSPSLRATPSEPQRKSSRPDMVIFLSDDHGQRDSTPYGAKDIKTPNMQRLASMGMVFDRAFVASPSCAPSRSAFLTGLMPARNGAEANHSFKRPEVRSLMEDLRDLGYESAAFGKVAHYKGAQRYGFDVTNDKYDVETVAKFLRERDRSKPLCLFVGTHHPHVPWSNIEEYKPDDIQVPVQHVDTPETRNQRARYYTDITKADRELGEIYELTQKELDPKKTLFMYTSDHGGQWPFGKWNLYDLGIQVPMIVVWPGVVSQGRSKAMVQWIDIVPTMIEIGGGKVDRDIDGRSFEKVLRGKVDSHRDAIYTTHHNDGDKNIYPCRSVRTEKFKYILNLEPTWAHTTHIDQGGGSGDGWRYFQTWVAQAEGDPVTAKKVQRYYERPAEELYDLEMDPDEMHNVASDPKYAESLSDLRTSLARWRKQQADNTPVKVAPRLLSDPSRWKFVPRPNP